MDDRSFVNDSPFVDVRLLVDNRSFDRPGRDPRVEDHLGGRRGEESKRGRRPERTVVDDDGACPAGERPPCATGRRKRRAPGYGHGMTVVVVPPARHGGVDRDPERKHAHEQAMEASSQGTPRSCGGENRRSGCRRPGPSGPGRYDRMRRGSGAEETDGPESVRRLPSLVSRRGAYATGGIGPVANTREAPPANRSGGPEKRERPWWLAPPRPSWIEQVAACERGRSLRE